MDTEPWVQRNVGGGMVGGAWGRRQRRHSGLDDDGAVRRPWPASPIATLRTPRHSRENGNLCFLTNICLGNGDSRFRGNDAVGNCSPGVLGPFISGCWIKSEVTTVRWDGLGPHPQSLKPKPHVIPAKAGISVHLQTPASKQRFPLSRE